MKTGAAVVLASMLFVVPVAADPPAPVVVSYVGQGTVRVQVSEGRTTPCDSHDNRPLFDASLGPDETWRGSIGGDCICVRHTSSDFASTNWSPSGLACRPRVCRGKVCTPAADPTIRVTLSAHD